MIHSPLAGITLAMPYPGPILQGRPRGAYRLDQLWVLPVVKRPGKETSDGEVLVRASLLVCLRVSPNSETPHLKAGSSPHSRLSSRMSQAALFDLVEFTCVLFPFVFVAKREKSCACLVSHTYKQIRKLWEIKDKETLQANGGYHHTRPPFDDIDRSTSSSTGW